MYARYHFHRMVVQYGPVVGYIEEDNKKHSQTARQPENERGAMTYVWRLTRSKRDIQKQNKNLYEERIGVIAFQELGV